MFRTALDCKSMNFNYMFDVHRLKFVYECEVSEGVMAAGGYFL